MFVSTIIIIYLGRKRRTPNTILWATLPLFRGLEWLIEVLADYSAEILSIEPPFITDRLEIAFNFCVSIIILAACLEFNGLIHRPIGKIAAILVSVFPMILIFVLSSSLMEEIESSTMFEGLFLTSDPFRFLFGFLIPVFAIIILLFSHMYYKQQVKRDKIFKDEKLRAQVIVISAIIFITAIANGFDYQDNEILTMLFRGITMALFVVLPLFIILSTDYGLQIFLVIQPKSGIPLFAYDFKTEKEILYDDKTCLVGGFLSAIISFSSEISGNLGKFLTIHSNNLYFFLKYTSDKIDSLQSVIYSKELERKTLNVIQQIEDLLAEKTELSEFEQVKIASILKKEYAIYF
jgi:hypothetical protein